MTIELTKSNGDKVIIDTNDIRYISHKEGFYYRQRNDNWVKLKYRTLVSCKNHDYYVLESIEELKEKVNQI